MLLTMLQIKLYKTFGNHGRAKNTELPKKWIYGVPWLNPVHLISVRSVSSQQALDLDFSDHQKVFRFKSTGDLLRSLAILKICSINSFVENALPVMRKCEQLFGERMFAMVARPTFYRQFVGGETEEELRSTCDRLKEAGIHLMVCPALEEDEGESGAEMKYENNAAYITEIGRIMIRAGEERPCLQFKV
ncbi:hydroxyproline dehydrogenase isoform X1 [Eurytemora carolleeae]|uniref:hydroxyproline dehydrogenase isoform X1 n=1 Tax=Eurytemora carolleeae TaxID=1294199 RepID=UPI000C764A1D|nr:hydroxyproline dehydrogenase isoform X1 [Eurytemora carolleeae]|eukprot:XP_023345654.1 hydroxyproline dehydrogenase-like isoform X1 [Eurytemora affinis]